MKKRVFLLFLAAVMLLAIPAYAVSPRTIDCIPDISFNGTEATCTATVTGDRTTDRISATMTLKRGPTVIDSWSDSASGYLKLTGTATVTRRTSYTLIVDATVNGVAQPTVTIYRTSN